MSKVKLYKFDRVERKACAEGAGSSKTKRTDLVRYEGETGDSQEDPAAPEPVTLEEAKREVAEALKEIWRLPESQRSSAIKRLIRTWHPDKNKDRKSFANEVTKFLLSEVERLKNGGVPGYHSPYEKSNQPSWESSTGSSRESSRGSSRGSSSGPSTRPSGSTWDAPDFEEFFNRYQRRQERKRARDRKRQETNDKEEPVNGNEARRWMRQTREDLEAAACLFQNTHFAFACFHCQQAVEKALKALMFAKGCLEMNDLDNHDIITLAYRASRMDPSLRAIPNMVVPMHDYYIKTRYPHYQRGSCQNTIPAEMFSHQDAENAILKAEEILQLIEEVI